MKDRVFILKIMGIQLV